MVRYTYKYIYDTTQGLFVVSSSRTAEIGAGLQLPRAHRVTRNESIAAKGTVFEQAIRCLCLSPEHAVELSTELHHQHTCQHTDQANFSVSLQEARNKWSPAEIMN